MKKNDKGGADWNLWADMEQAEIWEAVALSLDIEPNSLPGLDFRPIVGGPFDDCPDEFKRRLKLAVSKFDDPRTKIRLSSLRKWAEQLTRPWTFPDGFPPEPAAPHKSPALAQTAMPAPVVAVGASDAPAIPKNQRPDLLTPLIEKAQRGETDVFSAAVIWPKLCDMAECKTTPFIGKTESGLQWIDANDNPQFLTKDALGDRLRRQKKAAIERGKPR